MKVIFDGRSTRKIFAEPRVVISREEVEERQGMSGGPSVCTIDVVNPDGSMGRFWVSVRINNGRPAIDISTRTRKGDKTSHMTGIWFEFGHLNDRRKDAAEAAFADYDFGDDIVTDSRGWEMSGDEWTRVLSMEGVVMRTYKCAFIVRFKPGTAEVTEAYPGDPTET